MTTIRMIPANGVAGADIFLSASGYESRAMHAADVIRPTGLRIALGFAGNSSGRRGDNDERLRALGFELPVVASDDPVGPRAMLRDALSRCGTRAVVAIDYSSMTRAWLWGLIAECWQGLKSGTIRSMQLCYSPARYSEPPSPVPPLRSIGPVVGVTAKIVQPTDRVALILGLGYELERGLGLYEYVDADVARFFYADPGFGEEYLEAVKTANASLFNRVRYDQLIPYPLEDWPAMVSILNGVCGFYRETHRVVCAPMGPKPFSAMSCLVAMEYEDVLLVRVTDTGVAAELDRVPAGDVLCAEVQT